MTPQPSAPRQGVIASPSEQPDLRTLELRRRTFLAGAAGFAFSAALAALPKALADRGWLEAAAAAEPDLTVDTMNALVAFVCPGNDEYSVAQGNSTPGPGGIACGTTPVMIDALDRFVPAPVLGSPTVPISAGVAHLLNEYALQVNPAAANGSFASPFARLSFKEKGDVFRIFESDPTWDDSAVRYLSGTLPGFPAALTFSEVPAMENGKLARRPLGWEISGYGGVSDGWPEYKGYWRGRRKAAGGERYVRLPKPRAKKGGGRA